MLTQPPSTPDFPLLQMFTVSATLKQSCIILFMISLYFQHVAPRVGATVSQQLFVMHSCVLLQ